MRRDGQSCRDLNPTTMGRTKMADSTQRERIKTEAIVIGYAMSRLDRYYLEARKLVAWEQAYAEASKSLSRPTQTFKNLRDEFDPFHVNPRRGWHQRSIRSDRQRVLDELRDVSDEAIVELVDRIIRRENETTQIAIDSLATVNGVARNVAERLLTGRLAEEFFLTHSESLVSIPTADVIDMRYSAQGYDFAVRDRPEYAIEVKGLKATRGVIQFTDREWREAGLRRCNYWLVIIGNIAVEPTTRVIRDPCTELTARSVYRRSVVVEWYSSVSTT